MAANDQYVVDFPALFVAHDWVEQHCVVPDGAQKGEPFLLADWQAWCLLNFYRLKPTARRGQLAPAFEYRRGQIVLPQKAGKAPYTAAHVCVEAVGPALFAGWAKGGEVWDCRDHGCGCGWVYEYQPGEAMGMRWPTPLIQITAYSEDQTDNIYSALRPMIEHGPLSELIPKTGEEFIRLPNDGLIDTVTSNAQSRLGARVTFVPQDETGIWTKTNGMVKVAETQRRGLAGMGGRAEETTNAWDPGEQSVAQRTAESPSRDIFRFHPQAPKDLNYRVKADRRRIHRVVYQGSPWVDLDAIEAEAAELLETDPAQAERFFGNRVVAGSDKAFDADHYASLAKRLAIPAGRKVTLGFDGSLTHDATGLVVTDIEHGHQAVLAWWIRPPELDEDAEWQVPIDEVDEAVEFAFGTWDVWRLLGDPAHWRSDMNRWAGMYGDDKVVEWWTHDRKKTALAIREFATDMGGRDKAPVMSHGPLLLDQDAEPDARALAAHAALVEHVANAVRRPTNIRDEETGSFLWLIGKDAAKSVRKIDLAMAALLSWIARGQAIADGVLKPEPTYRRASWSGGAPTRSGRVDRSDYLPCLGCGKPIHPRLHEPDAPERGRCMRCRSQER